MTTWNGKGKQQDTWRNFKKSMTYFQAPRHRLVWRGPEKKRIPEAHSHPFQWHESGLRHCQFAFVGPTNEGVTYKEKEQLLTSTSVSFTLMKILLSSWLQSSEGWYSRCSLTMVPSISKIKTVLPTFQFQMWDNSLLVSSSQKHCVIYNSYPLRN